ncbi:RidA family protein [Paractinoplanes toevensis]|uniref:Endoribonuclease n=1 Tax=Paractinoplanes toevensis TaxID=571911 RepID=A0A919T7R8_9ACTN|nr:RidA family protein [Actinoplanes toevensis]GIM89982.1 endoribonuclease [Actinoplanes toevensis]
MNRRTVPDHPGAPARMPGMVTGVRAGGLIFLSALRGRDPDTGRISDDTAEQARQVFENLTAILRGEGLTLRHVVKVTLYLSRLDYRTAFHQVWMEYFDQDPPARTAVQVADANAAPGGNAHFVLDVIALAE